MRKARADQPETKFAAIGYTPSTWEGLSRFLGGACIETASNIVERSIRRRVY